MRLTYAIALVAAAYLLASTPDPSDLPRNHSPNAAQSEFRQQLAAAENCRVVHGESLLRRKADGSFVCVPRSTKRLVAANP